jgi:hypothetical protein
MQPNMANLLIALSVVAALLLSGCESQPTPVTQEPEPFKLPVSTFEISGKTDTTLFGPQGTRVFVPKEAFVFADGTPAQGPVKMEMKELYSTSDIVLSGTSTMSGISPLETGGMVHLQALCEGRELVLKSGVNVIVHFPKERGESLPMDLFYPSQGSSDSAVVDWSIDTTALVKSVLKLGMWGYRWVSHDDSTAFEFKPQNFVDTGYSWNPMERYVDRFDFAEPARKEIAVLDRYAEVDFMIDKAGRVSRPVVKAKVSPGTRSELIRFVRNLPLLEPGVDRNGTVIEREGHLGITDGGMVPLFRTDSAYVSSFNRKYARFEREPIKSMDDAELNYYIFSVSKLGWINCDRFLEAPERVDFAVVGEKAVDLKLVLKDVKGVLKPDWIAGQFVFHDVPKGAPATVIAIDRRSSELLTAIQHVTVSETPFTQLSYQPTTLSALRQELEAL